MFFQLASFWFIFLRETVKRVIGIKVSKLPGSFYRVLQLILLNYEAVYFVLFLISINYFTCRNIKILKEDTGIGLSFLSTSEEEQSGEFY